MPFFDGPELLGAVIGGVIWGRGDVWMWSGNDSGRVLLNRNGGPLCSEKYDSGKYQKTDNIKNAFARLTSKTGIKKPLISLKKTSASRLRDNEKYNSVRILFLGHAEPRLADEHYADKPQRLLDRAIRWLRKDLGIHRLSLTVDDDKSGTVNTGKRAPKAKGERLKKR